MLGCLFFKIQHSNCQNHHGMPHFLACTPTHKLARLACPSKIGSSTAIQDECQAANSVLHRLQRTKDDDLQLIQTFILDSTQSRKSHRRSCIVMSASFVRSSKTSEARFGVQVLAVSLRACSLAAGGAQLLLQAMSNQCLPARFVAESARRAE